MSMRQITFKKGRDLRVVVPDANLVTWVRDGHQVITRLKDGWVYAESLLRAGYKAVRDTHA